MLKKKQKVVKESIIQKQILQWLKLNRFTHWRNYVGPIIQRTGYPSPNPMAGLPDIFVISKSSPGKMFGIEVKTKVGKLTEKQVKWHADLDEAGVYTFVARDLQTVIENINNHENNRT